MTAGGYYRLIRGWLDHEIFGSEPYCRRAAWAWLLDHAAFKPHTVQIAGKAVRLERAQLIAPVRRLAEVWRWEPTRVHRFLKRLEACHMTATATTTATATGHYVITICNYDKYQAALGETATPIATPPDDQPQHERKKENSLSKDKGANAPPAGKEVVDTAGFIFGTCRQYLIGNGVADKSARSLLGKWRKAHGDGAVIEAVNEASRREVSEPVAWITKALQTRSDSKSNTTSGGGPPAPAVGTPEHAAMMRDMGM